jgi:hypothetical protein
MPWENKPGNGALFRNRDKSDGDNRPTLKGTALLQLEDGQTVELDIAAWTRESDKAGRWLSLSVKPKVIRQQFDQRPNRHDLEDEIEF